MRGQKIKIELQRQAGHSPHSAFISGLSAAVQQHVVGRVHGGIWLETH